jgi:uncharacterized peroxidase-related enzyme
VRHHGGALRALIKNDELLASLERNPATAALDERRHAIVSYAMKLTRSPNSVTEADIDGLRKACLSDAAIHDVAAITSYFNFVNRMALGLGVEIERDQETPPK